MKRPVTLLAAVILMAAMAGRVDAQQLPTDIRWDGLVVLRYRVSAGGQTPLQRAVATRQRMVQAINGAPLRPQRVTLGRRAGLAVIVANNIVLTTVTSADAAANMSSVDELSRTWLANFRQALPGYQPWLIYNR